ncbi:HAD family hydrolase [Candidatus Omnitrophota bacterium]
MKKVDMIIFDLDGTLIDSRADIANAVNHTLRSLGLKEKSVDEICSYVGKGVEELVRKSLGEENTALLDEALPALEAYYREHSSDRSTLYPHVEETLERFKDKKKVIATNRKREFALLSLEKMGIERYFEEVIGADDSRHMKPSPCPLDRTLRNMDISKDKAIIVGDMNIDIMTGKAAGIATCAVTYGLGKREDIIKAKPDYIIDDIQELKDHIE